MKKYIVLLFVMVFLVGTVNATLEGAAFGFAKDMGMSYLSSQNPALGQALSFAMCPECAIENQAMSSLNQVLPGASQIYGFVQNPEGAALAMAKQNALKALKEKLKPEEQAALDNILKIKPYMEEAFEVNPNAPANQQKGSVEIAENGDTIIKDGEGEVFAVIPPGFEAVENKDGFILINKNAKEDSILEIKGYKIQAEKDSQISFSEKENIQTINLESGNIQIGDTTLPGIGNASIQLNKENQIQFAEFTSEKGGTYEFSHNEQNFTFQAKEGGKVLFNPKDGIVQGENTEFSLEGQSLDAQSFQGRLDREGNFIELKLSKGTFKDNKRGLKYSSEQEKDFSIYFDGRDISNKENAISIFDEENRVDAKGFVKIKKPGKLSYTGESQEAFVNYHINSNLFEMQEGDAVIKNGFFTRGGDEEAKQIINIKNGGEKVFLVRQNLDSRIETESFSIKSKDGKEYIIDEKGRLPTDVVLDKDGRTKATLLQPSLYENAVNEGVRTDKEIKEMRTNLRDLIDSGAISQTEIDAAELGLVRLENIQSNSAGNFDESIERLEDYLYEKNPETGELIKKPRIPEAESFAKFTLAEIYNQKALSNEFGEGHLSLGEFGSTSPLHYKTEVVSGREVVTGWSPDGKEFIPMSQTSVPEDYPTKNYQGKEPSKQNIELINSLNIDNNADLLRQAANSRGTRLSGDSPSNTELYENMKGDYEKSINLFEEVKNSAYEKGNEVLFAGASQSLGKIYSELGDSEKAITYFNDVANKVSSKEIKSQAYFSSSIIQMQEQNFAKSLQSIRKSIIANPENVDALTKKIELQGGLLTTIKRKIIGERTALDDALDKKFGAGRGGFLNTVGEVFTKSGHIVRGAIDAPELIFGPIKEGTSGYVISFEGTDYKLSQQELGIRILEDLSKRGYDLNEFADSDSLTQRSILAREMNLDLESEIGKNFLQAVHAAENNHDVNLMLNYGVKKTIKDFGPGGALEETALEEFYLKTGESYESQGVLEAGLGDLVLGEVNLVNVLSFAVPVSTVTIAGKTLTVAGQAGRAARLIPGVSKGSSVVGKFRGVFGKNKVVQLGLGEGIESVAAIGAEAVFPGTGLFTEMMTGGSGLVDVGENLIKKTGRKAVKEGVVEFGENVFVKKNGDFVQSLIVKDSDSMESILKSLDDGQIKSFSMKSGDYDVEVPIDATKYKTTEEVINTIDIRKSKGASLSSGVEIKLKNGQTYLLKAEDSSKIFSHGTTSNSLSGVANHGLQPYDEVENLVPESIRVFNNRGGSGFGLEGSEVLYLQKSSSTDAAHFFSKTPEAGINLKEYEEMFGKDFIKRNYVIDKWNPEIGQKNIKDFRKEYADTGATNWLGSIKREETRIANWEKLTKIDQSLIADPFPVIYKVKYEGDYVEVFKEGHFVDEVALKQRIPQKNLVAYVPEDKIELTASIFRKAGNEIPVKAIDNFDGDMKFIQNFGGKPETIGFEDVVSSLTPNQIVQGASKNINQYTEAVLSTNDAALNRVRAFVDQSEFNKIDGIADKLMNGEVTQIGGYKVYPITQKNLDLMTTENKAIYSSSEGIYDPRTKDISINLESITKGYTEDSVKKAVKQTLAHEYFHAKFDTLIPSQKQIVYNSFKANQNFPEVKKIFLETQSGYKSLSDERLIDEILAFSSQKEFRKTMVCRSGIGCPEFDELLDDVTKQFFYKFILILIQIN